MKAGHLPGLEGLRLDTELSTFQDILSFYLATPERVRNIGKKIVAKSPLTPPEIIFAAGALPYDISTYENMTLSMLENRTNLTHEAVEAGISPELNPWQLILLGSELNGHGAIPADMYAAAVGGFDDQLTKTFQVIARAKSLPVRFVEVPRFEESARSWAMSYLEKELLQFIEWLELRTRQRVTNESLHEAITDTNQIRRDMTTLDGFLSGTKLPLNALEYYLLQAPIGDFGQDPKKLHQLFLSLFKELQARLDNGYSLSGVATSPTRLYMMGDMTQELSLFNAIENSGGCLVGCDFRFSLYYDLISDDIPPLTAFAQWIWSMPVNLPVAKRVKNQVEAIKKQRPDAVIINSSVGSRNLPGAERLVRDILKEELGVPILTLETTLPGETTEKVDYQVRAFLEMMR